MIGKDPSLPCGHPHDCLDTKTSACGWCCEISIADQANRERDVALREATDERAARRVQAKDFDIIRKAAAVMRCHLGRSDLWAEDLLSAVRDYDKVEFPDG